MSSVKLIPPNDGGSVSIVPPSSTSGADIDITLPATDQGFGKILQVQSYTKTNTASTTTVTTAGTTTLPYFFMDRSITLTKQTNKIIIQTYATIGGSQNTLYKYIIYRTVGSTNTPLFVADTSGQKSTGTAVTGIYGSSHAWSQHCVSTANIDTPNVSDGTVITYKVGVMIGVAGTLWINRGHTEQDSTPYSSGTSGIVLMEVAA